MKILIISQYFYPENFRINDVAKELVKRGHEVTVITGLPNYPEGKLYKGFRFFKKRREDYFGVRIIRVPIITRHKSSLMLALNYLSFMVSGSIRTLFTLKKYDVVYSYEVSPITQVFPGIIYSSFHRKPLIINSLDLWPESLKVIGIKENSLVFKVIKWFSSYVYRKGKSVIIPSQLFDQYLINVVGVDPNRIVYLPNHAENDYLQFDDKTMSNEKIHLLFAGNIGKIQGLDYIIDAVKLLSKDIQDKIIVDIVGDGSYLETLKNKTIEYGLSEFISFHGMKSIQEIKEYYQRANACLLTLEKGSSISLTVPAKLQGYMAAGKPILAAIDGSAAKIIKDSNCGVCVKAGDVSEFSKQIEMFVLYPDKYVSMGYNGRIYFKENFSLDVHTTKLLDILKG